VDGVDVSIRRCETLVLVSESGLGKTTMGNTILYLELPTGGEIVLDG
jgi:ABC-type oligopeptide transport system ATPase subunit